MSPARGDYRPLVSYAQAHFRLKVDRGRPSGYACVTCGGPAKHWAYTGGDPDELTERGLRYSLDQSRYEPMCVSCHTRHDRALADGRPVGQCPRGHLWAENEGIRVKRGPGTGLRFCRACNRESIRAWRLKNREQIKAASQPIPLFPEDERSAQRQARAS